MNRAKNGAVYRACATPEKKKQPKKQVRNNPRPEGKRKVPYVVAYPERHRKQGTTTTTSKSTITKTQLQAKRKKAIAKDKKPKTEMKKKVVIAKPKAKPSKPKNEGALYKAKLNKKVKDMTAEEKKEYTRLRVKSHRDKKKKAKPKTKPTPKPTPHKEKVKKQAKKEVKKTFVEEGDDIIARLEKQYPELKERAEKARIKREIERAEEDKKLKELDEKQKKIREALQKNKEKAEKDKKLKKLKFDFPSPTSLPFKPTQNDTVNKRKVVQYIIKNKKSIRDFVKKAIEEDEDTKKENKSSKGNYSFQKELIEEWFTTQKYYNTMSKLESDLIERGIMSGKDDDYKEFLQGISLIGSGIEFY